ncbi:MAG: zinc ribbon domain-containing protein [Deltaproteobacteria bacterium]|nr:zinc ribbon domain-containing protein [Deltaproteobacteria bacterium]
MPIYEYRCQNCNHKFEELVLSGSKEVKCPKCGQDKVRRQMSAFSCCAPAGGAGFSTSGSCGSGGFS